MAPTISENRIQFDGGFVAPILSGSLQRSRIMAALQVQTIESPQGVVVRLQGEAGYLDADTLHLPLLALLAQRPALVVFDMEQLAFVASVVMGALVRFRRSQIVHGGKVVLAALQPSVLESFQAARLLELFESADTVDQALSNAAS